MTNPVKVDLYNSEGRLQVDIHPKAFVPPIAPELSGKLQHQRAVFACLKDLTPRFEHAGITEDDYWQMIRSEFRMERSEFTEPYWARLSATLNACRRDVKLFRQLVKSIQRHIQHPVDATPVIFAEPDDISTCFVIRQNTDGTEKVVYLGEFSEGVRERCAAYVKQTQCVISLHHNGQTPEVFRPRISGLGWQSLRMDGGMFIDDRAGRTRRGRRMNKKRIMAYLNCKNGRFSVNVVSEKLELPKPIPAEIDDLEDAVEWVYQHGKWK